MHSPSQLTNLETQARELRFQALGRACGEHGIKNLILGHHEDDLVETTLYRLSGGALPPLPRSQAHIPECKGIPLVDNDPDNPTRAEGDSRQMRRAQYGNVFVAGPGVQIHKPLQVFSKARLSATCRYHDVKWHEDMTNQDPKLTPRNAIRHLLAQHKLPQSLQKRSLLQLVQKRSNYANAIEDKVKSILNRINGHLDLRSGVLRLYFQSTVRPFDPFVSGPEILDLCKAEPSIALALLKSWTRMVLPNSTSSNEKLEAVVRKFAEAISHNGEKTSQRAFNAGGIFYRLERLPNNCIWHLHRQRPATGNDIAPTYWLPSQMDRWQLFDERFWFKFDQLTSSSAQKNQHLRRHGISDNVEIASLLHAITVNGLDVRPLSREGLTIFKRRLNGSLGAGSKHVLKSMKHHLSVLCPGDLRWTFPVITLHGREHDILAMPTIPRCHLPGLDDFVRYKVRYAYSQIPDSLLAKIPSNRKL